MKLRCTIANSLEGKGGQEAHLVLLVLVMSARVLI
jgi:hypothetical protein